MSFFMRPTGKLLACGAKQHIQMQTMNINNVAVIGSGLMGAGIAQVSAANGFNVVVVDQSDEILSKARKSIERSMQKVAKKKFKGDVKAAEKSVMGSLARLSMTTDTEKAVAHADLAVEAIVENVDMKRRLFATMEKAAQKNCILATNTSSLRLADIATAVKRTDKFGGLHFFNPVPIMKLLEVVRTPDTSKETTEKLLDFGAKIGKTTVLCKDTPGFIVNRLLVPYLMEAVRMVQRGDASKRDVDLAMKLGAGYPMGPFELLDYVGLDTSHFIMEGWHELYPDEKLFEPVETLEKLVEEGKLGRKSGHGFYDYKKI